MIILLLLVVVAGLVVGALALAGLGPLATERGRERSEDRRIGCGPLLLAVPIGLVLVVVLLGAGAGVVGVDRGDGTDDTDDPGEPVVAPVAATAPRTIPGAVDSAALGPVVHVRGDAGAVGGLRTDTVLRVRVEGFPSFARSRALQCAGSTCANAVPVQLDEDGVAIFEYLVSDDFAPDAARGRCRLDGATCSLVIEEIDGDARASVVTLFADELPEPGALALEPGRRLRPREEVAARLSGFVPGAEVDLVVCALPASSGEERCSVVGESVVDDDGDGTATLRVPRIVGDERIDCERASCVVHVRSTSAFASSTPVLLQYALPAPVDYDGPRLLIGLLVAAVLLAIAAAFVLRTDWSPVGEAAAPEIDEAEYADLDALVAAMPPEEDLDELVARST